MSRCHHVPILYARVTMSVVAHTGSSWAISRHSIHYQIYVFFRISLAIYDFESFLLIDDIIQFGPWVSAKSHDTLSVNYNLYFKMSASKYWPFCLVHSIAFAVLHTLFNFKNHTPLSLICTNTCTCKVNVYIWILQELCLSFDIT